MIERTWDVLTAVWMSMLLGTALALVGTGAGWAIGRFRGFLGVRIVSFWLRRVIVPLLKAPSWSRRAGTIFLNNICVLSVLVASGAWHVVALPAVAGLGVSLGIALKCLSQEADALPVSLGEPGAGRRWPIRIGVILNLLEPPAIAATLGLCLGPQTIPLSRAAVWETFGVWVAPAMFIAACGEALWLGVARPTDDPPGHASAPTDVPPPSGEP